MSSNSISADSADIAMARLEDYLSREGYDSTTIRDHIGAARRSLAHLHRCDVRLEAAQPTHVEAQVREELQEHHKRYGRSPRDYCSWFRRHTAGIHMLLRFAQGQWPPPEPRSSIEAFHQRLCDEYAQWLSSFRSLAKVTIDCRHNQARDFLQWLGERGTEGRLVQLSLAEIDAFVKERATRLRRTSCLNLVVCLRCFLRFLHGHGQTTLDLAHAVIGPSQYAFERIPSALPVASVTAVLESTRKDHTPKGLRDYAVLLLLATYGLRAGEVTGLQLEDIDWRSERLRVRHSKTGGESFLPLLAPVGEAIIDYLRKGRPTTQSREVFIRTRAPYRPFRQGGCLNSLITRRLQQAGIQPKGRHGSHAFRHALAVNLLRAGVPMKSIGDVLGHQSVKSTAVYLKLATDDLRAVGLEVPREATR